MFGFRRTRLAIYGVAALILWTSTGHGPAMLGNVIETANAKLTSLLPGASAPAQAPLGAWRSCAPIPVYVNPGNGPDSQARLLHTQEAIGAVAAATGMPLAYAGTTRETPTGNSIENTQAKGTIVIAWTTPQHSDLLTESRVGGASVRTNDRGRISTGGLAINTDQLDRYSLGFGPGRTTGNVLLHEIAHTLGAPHSEEGTLMHSSVNATSPDGFTDADLRALEGTTPDC